MLFRSKVHAYSKKMAKWLGRAMLEVARDQMEDDEDAAGSW